MTAAGAKATPKRMANFLEVLTWCGNVTEAARCAGVDRKSTYKWKARDAEFAKAWDEAIEASVDILEQEARRRAVYGYEETTTEDGKPTKKVQKFSNTLLMFLLNGNRPEKYKRRGVVEHTGKDGAELNVKATIIRYPVNERDSE